MTITVHGFALLLLVIAALSGAATFFIHRAAFWRREYEALRVYHLKAIKERQSPFIQTMRDALDEEFERHARAPNIIDFPGNTI